MKTRFQNLCYLEKVLVEELEKLKNGKNGIQNNLLWNQKKWEIYCQEIELLDLEQLDFDSFQALINQKLDGMAFRKKRSSSTNSR